MANPRNARRPVGAPYITYFLANLERTRGFFSGKLIDYRMPCTASEDRTCQIVANLSVWNEFLWPLDLELRELPETGMQLGLINFPSNSRSKLMKDRMHHGAAVLYWLLSTHHCVARMHIGNTFAFRETAKLCLPVLFETLDENYSLKSVVFDFRTVVELKSEEMEKLVEHILSPKCLAEIELPRQHSSLCVHNVSAILRSTATLTVLDCSVICQVESTLARRFFTALRMNSTLRDLSLSLAVISADPALFAEFLSGDARLQTLRVVSTYAVLPDDRLRCMLEGMVKNRSVSNLQVENIAWDFESIELASKLLAENRVLQSFHVSSPNYVLDESIGLSVRLTMPPNTSSLQDAIARNSRLQYMTLNFSMWTAEHWAAFFSVLSKHTSLKMVTIIIGDREEYRLLLDVVKSLQESGWEEKVSFKTRCIVDRLTVSDCKYFRELSLTVLDRTKDIMLPLLQQLSTLTRLKELSLTLRTWDSVMFYAISKYISMTSTLRMLYLDLCTRNHAPELIEWWPALSRSLLLNKSIVALSIGVYVESSQNIELLGDAVMRSQTIRKLCLMPFDPLALVGFLRGLRADVLNNYALCRVTVDFRITPNIVADWFAVCDTSRRNSGFVARAAQFLNHARCDRLCAAGLDRVSRHPALLAELAEVLSIGEEEAARRVRQRFRNIEGLHEFMRLTGVVKQRVRCQPREDGRAQLDDLNSECWCHVRRYLQLDDVAFD
ncbi:uncharacterized protein [Dermacentor andersoni]|uniref:uncharacterized protein n=1 Tax=Dermacentor andersoni TaxID=34620 RepID=UPI002416B3DD|nr:uncharacterized protein LOC129384334 [Dermacentor andersoni]